MRPKISPVFLSNTVTFGCLSASVPDRAVPCVTKNTECQPSSMTAPASRRPLPPSSLAYVSCSMFGHYELRPALFPEHLRQGSEQKCNQCAWPHGKFHGTENESPTQHQAKEMHQGNDCEDNGCDLRRFHDNPLKKGDGRNVV